MDGPLPHADIEGDVHNGVRIDESTDGVGEVANGTVAFLNRRFSRSRVERTLHFEYGSWSLNRDG